MDTPGRVPMARPGYATKGQKIRLYSNHFKVNMANSDGYFFQYSVALYYEDGKPVEMKGLGRKVLDKLRQTYATEMDHKEFAYDGEKTLFTVGSLPRNKLEFTVVLDRVSADRTDGKRSPGGNGSPTENDKKRRKRVSQVKSFRVEISFATKIPMRVISDALRGKESEEFLEAIRVLDVVLRQHAARQGCLLVRQSFFHDDKRNLTDLGGGILGCRGFHSSFRATQNGLSLNMDGTLTTIVQPGPLVDFLLASQNVRDLHDIDWTKAKRILKNLRIRVEPSNTEYKICGFSDDTCKRQRFSMRRRKGESNGDDYQETEVTVYDYFANHRNIKLRYSGDLPCINVGKPKRPTYIPIELCFLLPLQRYTKALTVHQRSSLVEKSRQKPQEKMRILTETMRSNNYAAEPMLCNCGISINGDFNQVEGRVLQAPKLKFGNGEEFPRNGRWNITHRTLAEPATVKDWVIVNFSARCDIRRLCSDLQRVGKQKGIIMEAPKCTVEERQQDRRAPPHVRVEAMIKELSSQLKNPPRFILCILADRKNSEIYGPWKKKTLSDIGVFTQCLAPMRVTDQYLTNLLLKINAKLGGLNYLLAVERNIPVFPKKPTIIFGMDVSHGSPGQSGVPSIAAVVGSRCWPSIYRYRASVRSQSPKVEMIDSLFKPLPGIGDGNKDDGGIIKELLLDFFHSSGQQKPQQVIIFRDGVSESQFKQVLNVEFEQILQACKLLDESWSPKFTIIIAQKNHHTKFFQHDQPDNNVPPGTVVDKSVCHPLHYDFYMCAQAGMIGTTRPTHYHVLLDEIGFSPDELQELVHSLSYVYQRSTTAISIVAPVRYAHLAATQVSQFLKYEDHSETSSGHGSMTSAGLPSVPDLPRLHKDVCRSMFFC